MEDFEAFNILNISPDSSIEEIKKSFHKQIFLYHPDSYLSQDTSFTGILIEAYKNALKIAENKNKKNASSLKEEFKTFLNIDFFIPENISDVFFILSKIFRNIDKIIYSKKNLYFYKNLISFLIQNLKKIENSQTINLIQNILSVILILFNSRIKSLEINSKEEYLFETLRNSFFQYLQNIINSNDFLNYRFIINSNQESLIKDIIFYLKKTKELIYKEELTAMLFIIIFFTEPEFSDPFFESLENT